MLWSGEWVQASRAREAENRSRGRGALERGGDFMVRCLALERDVCSPEGCQGWLLDGPQRLFGHGPFSAPGRDYAGCDLRFAGLFAFYCFSKNGFSPGY
jgi:hypothetical protein